jgi:hypothetical protein
MLVASLEANRKTFHGVGEQKLEFQSLLKPRVKPNYQRLLVSKQSCCNPDPEQSDGSLVDARPLTSKYWRQGQVSQRVGVARQQYGIRQLKCRVMGCS